MIPQDKILQAAIDHAERYMENGLAIYARSRNAFMSGADWALKQLQWIKISEQMPPENFQVLCFIPDQHYRITTAFWEQKSGWHECHTNEFVHDQVTHWAYLPALPKT